MAVCLEPEALQELPEEAPDRLPQRQHHGPRSAQTEPCRDFSLSDRTDALPVLEGSVTAPSYPQDDAAVVGTRFRNNAFMKAQVLPIVSLHWTCLGNGREEK